MFFLNLLSWRNPIVQLREDDNIIKMDTAQRTPLDPLQRRGVDEKNERLEEDGGTNKPFGMALSGPALLLKLILSSHFF